MTETGTDLESKQKWIRLMADHSSTGIWLSDGLMAEPDELPVSLALHARIETRCGWYEQNQSYLFSHEKTREVNYGPFSQEGLNIAQAIKAELPEWTVIYFDEAAYQETADVNGGRNPTLDGGVGQPCDAIAVQPGDSGTFHGAQIRVRRREPVGRAQTHRGCAVRQGDDAGIGMR
jgi:hypothetical protein